MLFRNIAIVDENFDVREKCFVGVKDDRIAYVGKRAPKDADSYGDVIEGRGKLLIPGFVNAHAHTAMTLLRGYGENMKLQDWLFTRIFPFEDEWYDEAVYWATMLGLAESARAGITSTTDMYFHMKPISEAFLASKMKGNLGRSLSSSEGVAFYDDPRWNDVLAGLEYNGAGNGRIIADLSAHSEYTTREDTIAAIANEAAKRGLRVQVHVSETAQEHENCLEERHKTPAAYLASLGLFDVPATLAHCVWCDHDDIRLLKQKGCFVCSNPVSNAKLASGIMDMAYMKRVGVDVCLGTDSVASNNSLNFLEEMKFFSLIQKVHTSDPTFVTPKESLYMATRAGALSQGRADCGLIREGFKADLVVLDVTGPEFTPAHNLLNNLVYAADNGAIETTIVDGVVVYDKGEYPTMDIEKVTRSAKKATETMLAAVRAKQARG